MIDIIVGAIKQKPRHERTIMEQQILDQYQFSIIVGTAKIIAYIACGAVIIKYLIG